MVSTPRAYRVVAAVATPVAAGGLAGVAAVTSPLPGHRLCCGRVQRATLRRVWAGGTHVAAAATAEELVAQPGAA
jgi:hypothetical protein